MLSMPRIRMAICAAFPDKPPMRSPSIYKALIIAARSGGSRLGSENVLQARAKLDRGVTIEGPGFGSFLVASGVVERQPGCNWRASARQPGHIRMISHDRLRV